MNSLSSKSKPISQFLLSQSPSSSSRILSISLFSTTSSSHSSSSHSSSYHISSSRRHDEESKNVRVSVWWDIENCCVPTGVNVFKISQFITSAVRENGIKGPVQVTAFGDVFCLSKPNQEALSSTGVNLVHIPHGGKNSADRSLLVDLMYWVTQNPPPAHVFLISGDRDFAGILHKLRMNNYNILLAGKEGKQTPGVLCSAASIMWHWNELAKGENLSGRHFNQPPDGPFNSWYGHYRGTLEDPYAVSERQICSEADKTSNAELSSENQRRPVPVTILRQLRRIVNAFPDGLTITDLRSEMAKLNVPIDRNFYGYKKFSRFLLAMPHILKVEALPDGQFFLRPVTRRVRESIKDNDASVGSMLENENPDTDVTRKANGHTITRMVDVKPELPVSPYIDCRERTVKEKEAKATPAGKALNAPQKENEVASTKEPPVTEAFNTKAVEIPVAPKEEQISDSKISLLKRLWFGPNRDSKKSVDTSGISKTSSVSPKMSTPKEEESESINQHNAQNTTHSSSSTALNDDYKTNKCDDSEVSPSFITRLINWCKSWRNSSIRSSTEQSSEEPGFIEESPTKFDDASKSRKDELFSKDNFWSALQSFLKTRRGSDIVLNSTSREQFAEKLQKEGPLVLRAFQESDLHHLVDLLVSEKKWIAEFPTKTPRFRIIQSPAEGSAEPQPQIVQNQSSNGLSSIFMESSSQENTLLRVSSPLHKKPSEKSRSEVLADCQKLLDECLSQNPEGFNMCYFKKHFSEKYGYALDHQKLGYPKLVSLLQIMPGVKVEAPYIYSDTVIYSPGIASLSLTQKSSGSNGDVPDSPRKNEDSESPWEELGPVAKQERQPTLVRVNGDYEPSVSDDDDFSDVEEESTSSQVKSEVQNRSRVNEEDSSLLQILDSWYGNKDEIGPQDLSSGAEGLVDCSKEESEPPRSSAAVAAAASPSAVNPAWKQRPQKTYTFVADPIETKKDKLIDGILGSLKKSGDSKIQE